jgi:hypothetical protein
MHCEISDSLDDMKSRYPKFRAVKLQATPCGYAIEGLGFFFIPQDVTAM